MMTLESLRDTLPDYAKDLKLNLQSVLGEGSLTPAQLWGTALASAAATRVPALREAIEAEARKHVEPAVIEDALAAAVLMGMNNIYYRFRHQVGREVYSQMPARLRMNRLARPAASKVDFELYCLAVSAIHGCELCVRSHEGVVLQGGLQEAQVNDAVRIAATLHGVALALDTLAL